MRFSGGGGEFPPNLFLADGRHEAPLGAVLPSRRPDLALPHYAAAGDEPSASISSSVLQERMQAILRVDPTRSRGKCSSKQRVQNSLRVNRVREPGRRCVCAGDHTCTQTWTAAQRTGPRGPTIYPPCCSRPHLRSPPASDHPGTLTTPRPTMFRRARAQPQRTGARTSPSRLPSLTAPPKRPGKT